MKNVLGYVRVSTDTQETDRQVEAIKQYCSLTGLHLIDIIHEPEGVSGRSDAVKKSPKAALAYYAQLAAGDLKQIERCGYCEILARIDCLGGVDAVVFYALDRLSRDTVELLLLEKLFASRGCSIITINSGGAVDSSTASGWMQYTMQSMLAEFECRQVSERTKATLHNKQRAGMLLGRPPVGWTKINGSYVKTPEFDTVEKVHSMSSRGCSYRDISATLQIPLGSIKSYIDSYSFNGGSVHE